MVRSDWIGVVNEAHAYAVVESPPPAAEGPIVVQLQPELAVAGRVVDGSGEPLGTVDLWIEGERAPPGRNMFPGFAHGYLVELDVGDQVTEADGAVRFAHLEPGSYVLHAKAHGERAARELVVQAGDEDVRFDLDALSDTRANLTGVVSDALTGERLTTFVIGTSGGVIELGLSEEDLAGMDPEYRADMQSLSHWSSARVHSEEGRFEVLDLEPGRYAVRAGAPGYADRVLSEAEYAAGTHELRLELLPARDLELEVVDPVGVLLPEATVRALGADGARLGVSDQGGSSGLLMFGIQGAPVTLRNLPAEPIVLRISVDGEGHEFPVDLTTPYEGRLTLVIE